MVTLQQFCISHDKVVVCSVYKIKELAKVNAVAKVLLLIRATLFTHVFDHLCSFYEKFVFPEHSAQKYFLTGSPVFCAHFFIRPVVTGVDSSW